MSTRFASPAEVMRHALRLAERGLGWVEPNPTVGAVLVDDELALLGEGRHERFGGPHAEVQALAAAGSRSRGATLYCTLEPCAHWGRTPPCTDAIIAAGVRRVVFAVSDPASHSGGRGSDRLQAAGVELELGLLGVEGARLIAPFATLMTQRRPYVHAKWAMTLDGRIATRTGRSQWISNELSRAKAHELRGRMDAILVGAGTVLADDPLLTARPAGPRTATRIVLDGRGRMPIDCRLTRTTADAPLLVATTAASGGGWRTELAARGAEVLILPEAGEPGRLSVGELLLELGRRRMTNLLVEGGAGVLGAFFDADRIDSCHVFISPKLVGGANAPGPLGGVGLDILAAAWESDEPLALESDVYMQIRRPTTDTACE